MLLADPAARPTIDEVHATLMGHRSGASTTIGRAPRRAAPPGRPPGSTLRGKGLRIADDTGTGTAPTATSIGSPADGGRPSAAARDAATAPASVAATPADLDSARTTAGAAFSTLMGKLLTRLSERRSR